MASYTIGIEFGSLSGKAILVDIQNGEIVASETHVYRNGLIERYLPDSNVKLPHDVKLQNPQDYIDTLTRTIPDLLKTNGIKSKDVIGMGISFSGSVLMPVDKTNQPLCFLDEFKNNYHAWAKPWQYQSAWKHVDTISAIAKSENEKWLSRYGGKISGESVFPKIYEVIIDDIEIYNQTDNFLEASDWLVSLLTGTLTRNTSTLGHHAWFHHRDGFPKSRFFKLLHPEMENVIKDKFKGNNMGLGEKVGTLLSEWAGKLSLHTDVSVAVGNLDIQVIPPAVDVTKQGQMLMNLATSSSETLLSNIEKEVKGINGVVYGGVIPGIYSYQTSENPVDHTINWFVDNFTHESLLLKARTRGVSVHTILQEFAEEKRPGQSGLLALDWFIGDRSRLNDNELTGLLIGLTTETKQEDIYRAFVEASAFNKKLMLLEYEEAGIPVNSITICGEHPTLSKMLVQIYADVLNKSLTVSETNDTEALGSAIYASVAAKVRGGYPNVLEASRHMSHKDTVMYEPNPDNVAIYEKLYQLFLKLREYYGTGENDLMKELKQLKQT